MNTIAQVYEILKDWRNRFPNINCISVILFNNEMRIRLDWYGELQPSYTQLFTEEQLKNIHVFDDLDNYVLEKIEAEYRKWEVGEE